MGYFYFCLGHFWCISWVVWSLYATENKEHAKTLKLCIGSAQPNQPIAQLDGASGNEPIVWLYTDHLLTPRIATDQIPPQLVKVLYLEVLLLIHHRFCYEH